MSQKDGSNDKCNSLQGVDIPHDRVMRRDASLKIFMQKPVKEPDVRVLCDNVNSCKFPCTVQSTEPKVLKR